MAARTWRSFLCLLLVPWAAGAGIRFREVSAEWGLDFRHHHGGRGDFFMIETMGAGVAILDYDADGDEDVLYIDSGTPAVYGGRQGRTTLLRNDGRRFVDVTERSGIRGDSYGMGVTAGDVDGDDDLDVYVTAFGRSQLFLNLGDGAFRDATDQAGVANDSWGASAGFADTDRDGDLDLYVTNYVDFGYDNNPICGLKERALRSYCHPNVYHGLPDRFYRNRGDGTFEDATRDSGFGAATGNGLGVVFGDLDGDGFVDLFVANDMTPNFQFRNLGDGRFEEVALLSGTALSDRGELEAGMGVDLGDLDGDGPPDLMVTHLDKQTNAVYRNTGGGIFVDRRHQSRLAEPSLEKVGFGVAMADLDLDGDLDIAVANGHIIHNVEEWNRGGTYKQQNQIFENLGGGRFAPVAESGVDLVRASRGLAVGDLDRDGDLDLVITNSDDVSEVYENSSDRGGFLQVDLDDRVSGNRAGIGARLELRAVGTENQVGNRGLQIRETRTASSYLSQSSTTVVFGLGRAPRGDRPGGLDRLDRLEVTWPAGGRLVLGEVPGDRRIRLVRQRLHE